MKKLIFLRYPKIILLSLTLLIAYLIFYSRNFPAFHNFLLSTGYFGIFMTGMLYSYGFTSPISVAVLLILANEYNIFVTGILAGVGALVSDLIFFKFFRHSFNDEMKTISKNISNEKAIKSISKKNRKWLKKYLLPVIGGLIIASPLPDEIGISVLASLKSISAMTFSILSFLLNTSGILVILVIGRSIG